MTKKFRKRPTFLDLFKQNYYLIIAAVIIAGLIFLPISLSIESKSRFWSTVLNQLATTLLISGLFSGIDALRLREDFIGMIDDNTERILEQIDLVGKKSKLGLIHLQSQASSYDYSQLLLESNELTIVLNKGSSWFSHHGAALKKRFEDPNKITTVFFYIQIII